MVDVMQEVYTQEVCKSEKIFLKKAGVAIVTIPFSSEYKEIIKRTAKAYIIDKDNNETFADLDINVSNEITEEKDKNKQATLYVISGLNRDVEIIIKEFITGVH